MKLIKRLAIGLLLFILVAIPVVYFQFQRAGGTDGLIQKSVKRLASANRNDLFEDGRMHVFTLGTGTPQLGTGRMPAANAVIAGEEFILIDTGEGASRTMGELNLPVKRINTILITHWHSDHFAGFGQVLNQSWNADRNHDITVYGPEGVEDVMQGLASQYKKDIGFRSGGHVEHNDREFALGTAHSLNPNPNEDLVTVFERNGVKVSVFNVDHGHVKPAFGYRIEYKGKSVVFSGDTIATPRMIPAAMNADLLIHEAMNMRVMGNAVIALRDLGNEVESDRAQAVMSYHTDTIALAKIAAQAKVGKLVLNHLIPAPPNRIVARFFVYGMSEHYAGPIVIAEDGMEFTL